jgi:hypothetical protein
MYMQITVTIDGHDEAVFLNTVREALVQKFFYEMRNDVEQVLRAHILDEAKKRARALTQEFLDTTTLPNGQTFADFVRGILTRKAESWTAGPGTTRIDSLISSQAYNEALRIFQESLRPYAAKYKELFVKNITELLTKGDV